MLATFYPVFIHNILICNQISPPIGRSSYLGSIKSSMYKARPQNRPETPAPLQASQIASRLYNICGFSISMVIFVFEDETTIRSLAPQWIEKKL
jgi:hypothetical protein